MSTTEGHYLARSAKISNPMDGALLIDKPSGITSMDVIRVARKKLDQRKIGHSGTLDPFATGLMVLLLGKATRLQDLFQNAAKSYSGVIRLGLQTETDDITGVEHTRLSVDPRLIGNTGCLSLIQDRFSGEQMQVPPAYSAIKSSGVPSYRRARAGEQVELAPRKVKIEFEDLCFHGPESIRFEVRCSKGTYIRALARDIGELLGCGACLESLRRTYSAPFSLENAMSLDEFEQGSPGDFLMGMSDLVSHLPRVELDSEDFEKLAKGMQSPLKSVRLEEKEKLAAVFSSHGEFGALIERDLEDRTRPWKLRLVLPR